MKGKKTNDSNNINNVLVREKENILPFGVWIEREKFFFFISSESSFFYYLLSFTQTQFAIEKSCNIFSLFLYFLSSKEPAGWNLPNISSNCKFRLKKGLGVLLLYIKLYFIWWGKARAEEVRGKIKSMETR